MDGCEGWNRKKSWGPKNGCFWTAVLGKTHESHLDCKEIQPVHPKGNQCWIFIGRTDAEAEAPILWPPDAKSWLIWKDPDAGKDWGQEEKGIAEEKVVREHDQLNGHELSNLQETVKDREAWRAAVPGVSKSWTRLSDWTTAATGTVRSMERALDLAFDQLNCTERMQSKACLSIYLSSDQNMNLGCLFKLNVLLWKDNECLFEA